jgi:HAD superfamily hydrolase (TIGR01509 family)
VNLSGVDAVVFDMDGLLVDSERLARTALTRTAHRFGLDPDERIFAGMIGLPEDGSIELLQKNFGAEFAASRFLHAAARAGDAMVESGLLQRKPGALECIRWLEELGIPKAVATSSSRTKAVLTLTSAELIDHFGTIVTRTDVPRGKPYPDLYVRAALELRCDAGRCIAFEDSYNGVRAAYAAGMRVIMVPDLLPPTAEMAEMAEAILPDLFAAIDALDRTGLTHA